MLKEDDYALKLTAHGRTIDLKGWRAALIEYPVVLSILALLAGFTNIGRLLMLVGVLIGVTALLVWGEKKGEDSAAS